MALTMPYVTETFTAYLGDVQITNLSMAVWLTDEYTCEKPIGRVKVMLKDLKREAFKNLSGYYCFIDVPEGNYTMSIETDSYFPIGVLIKIPFHDPKNPVKEITLKPNPGYPFPQNATLVRGVVVSNTDPVVKANVKVIGKSIETMTDKNGEFLLFFKKIDEENVIIRISKGGNTKDVPTTIKEGKTVSTKTITFP
jgi:hypothetical protein